MLVARILSAIATIWLATTLAFVALRILPGDPVSAQAGEAGLSSSQAEYQRELLGLDQPLATQYITYWRGISAGDWGTSLYTGLPVTIMIAQQALPTFQLAVSSMLVATLLGFLLGYLAVFGQLNLIRHVSALLIDLSLAVPIYWTGTLVVFVVAFWVDDLRNQLWIPATVLGFHVSSGLARMVRTQLHDALKQPYVTVARSQGLLPRTIRQKHILQPILATLLPVIVLQFGYLLSGTVITESIFQRTGIGSVLLRATLLQDYPVVQGIVLLMAIIYTVLTLISDFGVALLDPRIRQGSS
ncbi:MAG: hypothetical protein CL607_07775 [Anaerolineaceae bacterium]|nr:hypothetical protein [Anaerolineaceae bacterium]